MARSSAFPVPASRGWVPSRCRMVGSNRAPMAPRPRSASLARPAGPERATTRPRPILLSLDGSGFGVGLFGSSGFGVGSIGGCGAGPPANGGRLSMIPRPSRRPNGRAADSAWPARWRRQVALAKLEGGFRPLADVVGGLLRHPRRQRPFAERHVVVLLDRPLRELEGGQGGVVVGDRPELVRRWPWPAAAAPSSSSDSTPAPTCRCR